MPPPDSLHGFGVDVMYEKEGTSSASAHHAFLNSHYQEALASRASDQVDNDTYNCDSTHSSCYEDTKRTQLGGN